MTDSSRQVAGAAPLRSSRLLLRRWKPDDRPFAAEMNADPRVMEFFPGTKSAAETDEFVDRIEAHFDAHGFGWWAVEAPRVAEFVGCVGLIVPRFEAAFTPCVEIGWRLRSEFWGRGYATEAAARAIEYGFDELRLDEIVSFTVPANVRSRRVMEKLGMICSPADDFEHPSLPAGHPLRPHVLYRLRSDRWKKAATLMVGEGAARE